MSCSTASSSGSAAPERPTSCWRAERPRSAAASRSAGQSFGSLDAITRVTLQDELAGLQAATGKTIVFVTHDVDEAVYLGDRVVVLAGQPARVRASSRSRCPDRATGWPRARSRSSSSFATRSTSRSGATSVAAAGPGTLAKRAPQPNPLSPALRALRRVNVYGLVTVALLVGVWQLVVEGG